jgi:predicted negative regulator of RcsB-dependent stress response
MFRAVVVFVILAAIGGYIGWRYHAQDQAQIARQSHQLDDLGAQVEKLKSDNDQLHTQLDKVQEENNNLKTYNDMLQKALETAKVTGKVPVVPPYPPK